MEECIFCKIIKGEIPSYKIYEDDFVFAFLDNNPSSPGHTLIIPKKHSKDLFDIEEEDLKRVIFASKKIAQKMKEVFSCEAINIFNNNGSLAGQIIFHFHIHVVPRGINLEDSSFENIKNKLKIEQ